VRRKGYEPAGFKPLENPFYAALPYGDMERGRDYCTPTTGIPDDIATIFPFALSGLSTISNAESSARILCKHTTQTVEKNLQDDVHFRKSRSSI
jgi:hypothetical protein